MVSSSKPRCVKSSNRALYPWSYAGATMSRIPSIDVNGFEPWMSQVISSNTVMNVFTVTNRTPASIKRRASKQLWPKRFMP